MDQAAELSRGPSPEWAHSCTLEAEPRSAARARSFVLQHLVEHRLLHVVDAVRLVASELAANAIVHARTPFTLTLARTGSALLLIVADESPRQPARRPPRALEENGYGLTIVELMTLEWGTTTDGAGTKTVWATFDARPPRAGS
jgi:anti-sigma regulatory factor (Ser/Thr protein kinase)